LGRFVVWDHLAWTPDDGQDLADTTVALTAIALATERVRFGALVTPLARRRPWKLAKETATLDRLSGGRLVVATGLGARGDMSPFGEGGPPAQLAARLDEGLDLLAALWSGQPANDEGEHFRVHDAVLRPTPLQHPASRSGSPGSGPTSRRSAAPPASTVPCRSPAGTS
jgi:alkanesulfonate monooxygenase SsuD/methylene tetrahydromethanopterin reductase-like flavin-dependent oxidoreductase (luciferase family)